MSIWRPRTAAMLAVCLLSGTAFAQVSSPVSLTATGTASTQNFDTLASTGTSSATPAGYGFAESGSNADTNYAVSTGSGTAGDTYSFGATGNTERAFGGLQSGSLVPTIGAAFTNNTGTTITSLVIAYTGEQWRLGATGRTDRLDFQYSLNATSLTTGTWVDVNALDFAAPISTGTAGALNGNAAANQAAVSASISSLSIATGASFLLRWNSFDATGADDGLAIDNFSITPQGTVGNTPPTLSYNPASSVNFPAGLSGATVNASIVVTPSGGAGSGAAATTTVNACAISGAGAAAFGAVSGQPLSFVGSTTTPANLGLSCTIAASAASASLSCDETSGIAAPVVRSWTLNCPAATPDAAPTVLSTVPANGATGVVATSNLTVSFSEGVTTAAGWLTLDCSSSGSVAYSQSGSGASRTIDPTPTLAAGESCTALIDAASVSDLDGGADFMAADYSWNFSVFGSGDQAPTVTFTAPAAAQNPVAVDASLTVVFSEPVTLTAPWFTLSCSSSGSHSGPDTGTSTRRLINPGVDFSNGESCTLTVLAAQVLDQDGTPNAMAANVQRTFTIGDYYATVNAANSTALRSTLHAAIDDHTTFPYTDSGNIATWNILELADENPLNSNQIVDVYRNRSYTKVSDRAGIGSGDTYNREHTWPNSLGFGSTTGNLGFPNAPYTDTHMLYLSDTAYNSDRGNKPYADCPQGSGCSERVTLLNNGTGGGSGSYPGNSNWVQGPDGNTGSFEPWAQRKGDLARAVLYMDIRYEGGVDGNNGQSEPDLQVTDTRSQIQISSASPAFMGLRSTLIAWHSSDPPDAAERLRNDVVYAFQKNRNPFIDHPEYVACLFNGVCSVTPVAPTLAYNPVEGSSLVLSGGGAIGTDAGASIVVTPSGGAGGGASATSKLDSCSLSGAGASSFATVLGTQLSFVGATTAPQSLALSCTRAASVATASLTCLETIGLGAPAPRSFSLTCPAAASGSNLISISRSNQAYTQSFDTLGGSEYSSQMPAGWRFSESGSNADTTYQSGSGSGSAGDTWAYGAGACDRALGTLLTTSLTSRVGACFINNTGRAINTLRIAYSGEHWRMGNNAAADRLDFQTLINPSTPGVADAAGTWVDANALDFSTPSLVSPNNSSVNGNLSANRAARNADLAVSVPAGEDFCLRWLDSDLSAGADHGLAVDDFSLIADPGASAPACPGGLCVPDVTVTEGNAGSSNASFLITLSAPAPSGGVLFDARTAVETASNFDNDFVALEQLDVSIPAGSSSVMVQVQVTGDTRPEPTESFRLVIGNVRGSGITIGDAVGVGTITTDDPFELWQVQGAGEQTALAGQSVSTVGNIVTAIHNAGFFMQTPASRSDGNALTSDAVYVFTGSTPALTVGNLVDVTGRAEEFFCQTQINATFSAGGSVSQGGAGPALNPLSFNASRPSPQPGNPSCAAHVDPETANFECFEGMLVNIADGIVQAGNQRFPGLFSPPSVASAPTGTTDVMAETVVSATSQRAFRSPGFAWPGFDPGLPWTDYNPGDSAQVNRVAAVPVSPGAPQLFELDPDALVGMTNQVLPGGTRFSATGVLSFEFDDFEFWPTSFNSTFPVPPYPRAVPDPLPAELSIGSLNAYRLYDANGTNDDVARCDGLVVDSYDSYSVGNAAEVTRRINKLARYVIDQMKSPDVVALQEVENIGVLTMLADELNARDPSLGYQPFLIEGNDRSGIDPGYLLRSGGGSPRLSGISVDQLGFNERLTLDNSCLHDRPPLRLRATFIANGTDFSVINNHTRSLLGNDEASSEGARVRQKRFEQADSIYGHVRSEQQAFPGRPVIVVGDHNSYQFPDGFVDVIGIIRGVVRPSLLASPVRPNTDPVPLVDAVDLIDPAERYSYLFDRMLQSLDHALLNDAAQTAYRSLYFVRNNVDAPAHLLSLAENGCSADIDPSALDQTIAVGSAGCTEGTSDHEGLVLRLFGGASTLSIAAAAGIAEGNAGSSSLDIDVTLSGAFPAGNFVRVPWRIVGGSATLGVDFSVPGPGQFVDLSSGLNPRAIQLAVLGDTLVETDETIEIELGQPVDLAGNPLNIGLDPAARRATLTISNDDLVAAPIPNRVGNADRGFSSGDFVSQSLFGSDRRYRHFVEVLPGLNQLLIEIYDADFGAGGAADTQDVAASGSFNPASAVTYSAIGPSGQLLQTLTGTPTGPIGADGQWSSLLTLDAPTPGHYEIRIEAADGVVDSNGYSLRARGLVSSRGGANAVPLNIYSDSYLSLGHPASPSAGTSSLTVYPWVTEGCQLRTRTFDFDTASTIGSGVSLSAPNGFSQSYSDAQMAADGSWNTLDSSNHSSANAASGYGIWTGTVSIEGGAGSANQGTLYFGPIAGLSGSTVPSSNPPPVAFRVYQPTAAGAPQKARLTQSLFHISGANPPSPGNPGLFRVSLKLSNPSAAGLTFSAPNKLVRALVPFGGSVRYQGGAQPDQGSLVTEPALGGAGEISWNPGVVAAGSTVTLTYVIEVAPTSAGVTLVTGSVAGNSGSQASFVDETAASGQARANVTLGPLCELSVNSAGGAVSTPVTLASMQSSRSNADRIAVQFTVATQIGVAGYRIHEGSGDLRTPAGVVIAASGDSLAPVAVQLDAAVKGNAFYLEVLDIDDSRQWFGPFAVGAVQGSAPDLPAIDWPSLRREAGSSAMARRSGAVSADPEQVRLRIDRDGPVRVSAAEILAMAPGLDRQALSKLRLDEGGRPVPFDLDSEDAAFSADDTLWFRGQARNRLQPGRGDAWRYSTARDYVLSLGTGGRRMQPSSRPDFSGSRTDRHERSSVLELQSQYSFSSPADDPFAMDRLLAQPNQPAVKRYSLLLPQLTAGPVQLSAEVWGGADFPALADHEVQLQVAGQTLASARFDGLQALRLEATVDSALMQDGVLPLDVRLTGNNGQSFDLLLVDRIQTRWNARLVASQGQLSLPMSALDTRADRLFGDRFGDEPAQVEADRVLRVEGFAAQARLRAWLLSAEPRRLVVVPVGSSWELAPNAASGSDELLVFDESTAQAPQVLPTLATDTLLQGPADYLVISHPQFIDGLGSFVAARQAGGHTVKVVSTEAIAQAFGDGQTDSESIRSYLRSAHPALGLKYVLLVGGDSSDPLNYLGAGSLSFVPTPYLPLHPVVRFAPSDALYADVDGDAAPEFAIGRWPVRNAAELAQIIGKTLQSSDNRRALMLADNRDVADAYSFAQTSDQLIDLLGVPAQRAYLDQLPASELRSTLLQRVAANDRLIHYFGHSGPTTWTYPAPGIISPAEIFAGALNNSQPDILIQWGCWNSYHVMPQYQTMAHAWLLGPRGAAAVIGAATLTDAANDEQLAKELMQTLRTEPTLGDALRVAKRRLADRQPGALDVLLGTTLLGDPSLKY